MQLFFGPTQLSLLQIRPFDSPQNSRHLPSPSEMVLTSLTNDASFFRRQLVAQFVPESPYLLFLLSLISVAHAHEKYAYGISIVHKYLLLKEFRSSEVRRNPWASGSNCSQTCSPKER